MQQFVLPPNAGAAWGKLKHELPPPPTLPARRAPKVKAEPHGVRDLALPETDPAIKRRGGRQNQCLGCRKPFAQNDSRFKLIQMVSGSMNGARTGLGIDFCVDCGPKAIEAIEAYFGGTSFVYR